MPKSKPKPPGAKKRKTKAYKELINRVRFIDTAAAKYLDEKAAKLETFVASNLLCGAFVWKDTPQGEEYWRRISKELEE